MYRVSIALALLLALWATGVPAAPDQAPVPAGGGLRSLVEALADRFGPIEREPGFEALRPRLARAGLVPSSMFDDATAWTTRGDDWRAFELAGLASAGTYRMGVRADAPPPARVGQYRGRVRLQRLAGGRFEWTASDELAVGPARVSDLAGVFDALLRRAEHFSEASARAAIAEGLPRASARFGQLLRIERLTIQPDAHGATAVHLAVRLTPAGIRNIAPRYAEFLEKHVQPMRVSLVVSDAGGVTWWTLDAAEGLWTVRVRVRDGSLVPLEGPADRRLPGRIRATADLATRLGRFDVGARHLVGDVALTRAPGDKGFSIGFLQEPDWRLPFLVETVLDSPLHYPFDAPGSEAAWAARETPGGTMLVRRYRARVRESWILRWLGSMVNDTVGDFRREAEREADRYTRSCLLALRDDLAALGGVP